MPGGETRIAGRSLCRGEAEGVVLRLDLPLSFWGGTDHEGRIIDRHHPQCGQSVAGRILVMSSGRGSSSSSYVLAEAIRSGHAPAAIVLAEPDAVIALGAMVASELYGEEVPVVLIRPADLPRLHTGGRVRVGTEPDSERGEGSAIVAICTAR